MNRKSFFKLIGSSIVAIPVLKNIFAKEKPIEFAHSDAGWGEVTNYALLTEDGEIINNPINRLMDLYWYGVGKDGLEYGEVMAFYSDISKHLRHTREELVNMGVRHYDHIGRAVEQFCKEQKVGFQFVQFGIVDATNPFAQNKIVIATARSPKQLRKKVESKMTLTMKIENEVNKLWAEQLAETVKSELII